MLNTDRDAMGHELIDYLMEPSPERYEIIERGDGYITASPMVRYYFSDYSDWTPIEHQAFAYIVPGRVLDVGCGAGRVALYLQAQGHEVLAIDNSPLAIEVCRKRGVKDARILSITKMGAGLGIFDNIIMMGNNWGLMANRKRAGWLLRRFYSMTSPGARLIVESNDIYQTDNPMHLAYQVWNREHGRMSGQIRMRVRYGIYVSKWLDYLMVSKSEMQEILAGTGWRMDRHLPMEGKSIYAAVLLKE
jgi:SAM-dependent methyltransferase